MSAKGLDVELVDEFHQFLTGGRIPGGITMKRRPRKMTGSQAMAVIYVLQEFVHCIPDRFEMCVRCERIYDTEGEGHTGSEGQFHCDNCSYLCNCKDCKKHNGRERDEHFSDITGIHHD